MADGDLSTTTDWRWIDADTLSVTITGGHSAGETWHVRDALIDAPELRGVTLLRGQGAWLRAIAWADAAGGELELLQVGVDQWERLVADVRYVGDASNWSVVAAAGGYGRLGTLSRDGGTGTVTWVERFPVVGIGGPLVVDLTRP